MESLRCRIDPLLHHGVRTKCHGALRVRDVSVMSLVTGVSAPNRLATVQQGNQRRKASQSFINIVFCGQWIDNAESQDITSTKRC